MKERTFKFYIALAVTTPLIGLIVAVALLWNTYVFASDIALFFVMYTFCAFGVTIGYHRMLTHRGFLCPEWLRGFFLICGTMAMEGGPLDWSATHIKHHAHSDEEDDPHSPLAGFWHAHMGWLFGMHNFADPKVYVPQLLEDKTVMFVQRNTFLWMFLSYAIPFVIGGWTGLLWGGLVRIAFVQHVTWSVNSVCHSFGRRAFETTDESRNEWLVGLLAFGEGWHNNHHAFPENAFHGMRWWQIDFSGLLIRALESVGLAWNVQRVSKEAQEAHRIRSVTMSESLASLREQAAHSISLTKQEMEMIFSRVIERTLSEAEHAQFQKMYIDAMSRLAHIRERMTLASHMKKQKLQKYMREAQEMLQNVRIAAKIQVPAEIAIR